MIMPHLLTDSCADLPSSYYEASGVDRIKLSYSVDDTTFVDESEEAQTLDFYRRMREGGRTVTSMINVQTFFSHFEAAVKEGRSLIYIGFSSALSSTYSCAATAREMVLEQYPQAQLAVIDSLCASGGQGLLVYCAAMQRDKGLGFEELTAWIEQNKLKVNHWVFVDDLRYLQRGGRLSRGEAFFGNLLAIKPLIWMDAEGHLAPYAKEKGKKKVLRAMLDKLCENIEEPEKQTLFIYHSDYLEGAQALAEEIRERLPQLREIRYEYIGVVIGAHTGPGILSLFFMGKDRRDQL